MSMSMSTSSSIYAYHPDRGNRTKGLAFVIGLHLVLIYGFMTGLHHDVVKLIPKNLVMVDVPTIELPPPPIVEPKPRTIEPVTRDTIQPKDPVVPVTEMPLTNPTALQIASDPAVPTREYAIQTSLQTNTNPQAAVTNIALACNHMVAPDMPRRAMQEGISGVVTATAVIRGGAVVDVTNLTGPRIFHSAVRSAMLQYQCNAGLGEVTATQVFDFKFSD